MLLQKAVSLVVTSALEDIIVSVSINGPFETPAAQHAGIHQEEDCVYQESSIAAMNQEYRKAELSCVI